MKDHIKKVHLLTKLYEPCTKCGKMYKNLKYHMKETHTNANLSCAHPGCNKKFKSKRNLSGHMIVVHSEPTTVCTNCGKVVKSQRFHFKMCSPSQEQLARRKCHICEKVLSSQPSLNHHLEGKHGEGLPEVQCPDCGVLVKYIKQHMQSQHTPIDKSKLLKESCLFEGCDKRFRYKQGRDMHYK